MPKKLVLQWRAGRARGRRPLPPRGRGPRGVSWRMAAATHHSQPTLYTGDWLFGLCVLTFGVLLPVVLAWRKLFGGSASGSKRSQ